jgi:CRP-like cAMP-binding protein
MAINAFNEISRATSWRVRTGNGLLDGQSGETVDRLLTISTIVTFSNNTYIYVTVSETAYVYFPISGIYSLGVSGTNGQMIESLTVGREGMLGLPGFLGAEFAILPIITRIGGQSLRISKEKLLRLQSSDKQFSNLLQRYIAYALCHASQNSLCYALHSVEERACRLLLSLHDRAEDAAFCLTHETLAEMLGVQRPSISTVAKDLQRRGLIDYRRGKLRVVDPATLETLSCECYETLDSLYSRIVGTTV